MRFEVENGVLEKYTEEDGITEAVIPDGVTSIGNKAFRVCKNLESVRIPKSVTSIGNMAFACCGNLQSVELSEGLTSIEDGVFCYCKNLRNINIPESVTSIGNEAFRNCLSLESITIPDSVTSIGEYAFGSCVSLQSIVILYGVTSIGDNAFCTCLNLQSITIPDSVTSIGESAFWGCRSIRTLNIPDSVVKIGNEAFVNCNLLKSLTIFGYTVDATQCNWEEINPSEILSMLNSKDYFVEMDCPTKYQFVAQVFLKDNQPEAEVFIRRNLSKILRYFIDINDYDTVKGLLDSGKFITRRNIMKFVDYAIVNTQKGGDMQIQIYIADYKNRKFPDTNPLKDLKF